jgi:hypothetical protein
MSLAGQKKSIFQSYRYINLEVHHLLELGAGSRLRVLPASSLLSFFL